MRLRPAKQPSSEQQWLIDACSAEIRVHRIIFLLVLSPLLGFWLPHLLFYLGLSLLIEVHANVTSENRADSSLWQFAAFIVSLIAPLAAVAFGAWRERRRLNIVDKEAVASRMAMPERQGALLLAQLKSIWEKLSGGRADCPRLVCYRNFDVLAHAYDNKDGQTIEVSAGLASRAVQDDPLALSILRHEVAHLVHHDLPAIRRESIAAGAAVLSADVVTAMCLLTTIIILTVTDFGKFPLPWSFTNIIAVHLTVLLAALIITLPLVLGRFVIRRYAGFIFALIEMRADVSAGIWGEGLESLSQRLKTDPDIRPTTVRELGFAYISPSLSHLPAQERASLLSKPARLATPKLSYFAVALGAIWLLNFHQGNEVWDFFLLCAAVALLQGLTVQMIVTARSHLRLTPSRAAIVALGLLMAQALPLISIEGLAYLAEHLTAAIVRPGGFGSADNADYLRDTVETFQEFARFAAQATGRATFVLAVALAAFSYWLISRLPAGDPNQPKRVRTVVVALTAIVVSIAVSYKFFQEALYWPIRVAAFAWYDPSMLSGSIWSILPASIRHFIAQVLWEFSEFLHGPPILASYPWLRLILPNVAVLVTSLFAFSEVRPGRIGAPSSRR